MKILKKIWNKIRGKEEPMIIDMKDLYDRLLIIAKKYYDTDYCVVRAVFGRDSNTIVYETYINGSSWFYADTFEDSVCKHINYKINKAEEAVTFDNGDACTEDELPF